MPAFRKILLAADFSIASHRAFEVACALAHPGQSRLHLLHVVEPTSVAGELGVALPVPDPAALRPLLVERLRAEYAPGRPIACDYEVVEGPPATEIVDRAEGLGADLIVLGTHGRRGLARLLTGSVAEAVLRRAHCPVLALRDPRTDLDERGADASARAHAAHA